MNGKKDISTLNIRVTIKQWNFLQDAGGGSYYDERQSFDTWANKRNVSGSQFNSEAQQQWQYNTVFTVRYNPAIKSNFTIDESNGQRWDIDEIKVVNEGYKAMMELRCTTSDINIDVS